MWATPSGTVHGRHSEVVEGAAEAGALALPLEEAVALGVLATAPGLWGDLIAGGQLSREQAIELVWSFLSVNVFGETAEAPKAPRRTRGRARSA